MEKTTRLTRGSGNLKGLNRKNLLNVLHFECGLSAAIKVTKRRDHS